MPPTAVTLADDQHLPLAATNPAGATRLYPSQLEELEAFLENQGIFFESLDRKERSAAVGAWSRVFGRAFLPGMRYKEGNKARHALSQLPVGDFLLFSVMNETPIWRSSWQGPRWAYKRRASTVPNLSKFHTLDFAVVASDYSWTMVYTHEGDALGGPYFAEKDWALRPIRELKPGRRRGPREKHQS